MQSNIKPIMLTFKAYEGSIYKLITSHPCQSAFVKECVLARDKLEQENIQLKAELMIFKKCGFVNVTNQNDDCCEIGGI